MESWIEPEPDDLHIGPNEPPRLFSPRVDLIFDYPENVLSSDVALPLPESALETMPGGPSTETSPVWTTPEHRFAEEEDIILEYDINLIDPELQRRLRNLDAAARGTGSQFNTDIMLLPETRPISHEQLLAEVEGIYKGLLVFEERYWAFEATTQKKQSHQKPLNDEQWYTLMALHRSLLHEHHDFSLTSPRITKCAFQNSDQANSGDAVLQILEPGRTGHDSVQAFEDTWNGFLEDLRRHRMAIEEEYEEESPLGYNVAADIPPMRAMGMRRILWLKVNLALEREFQRVWKLLWALQFSLVR
jgi:hypothetical protein